MTHLPLVTISRWLNDGEYLCDMCAKVLIDPENNYYLNLLIESSAHEFDGIACHSYTLYIISLCSFQTYADNLSFWDMTENEVMRP